MRSCSLAWLAVVAFCAATPAQAQWAVIDVQAIAQLVRQIQTMEEQLQVAQMQLAQAQQAFNSMTGPRGMQSLLNGIQRNYLPKDSAQLLTPAVGGPYSSYATAVNGSIAANALLSAAQLARLSPADRSALLAARQTAAVRQSVAQESLGDASARFGELQTLIDTIGRASDQKAVLELQARIAAELGMLQGEQNKLATLAQALQAQDTVNALKEREASVAEQGDFSTRLRPTP